MGIGLPLNGASELLQRWYAKYIIELIYVAFYCATMLKGPNDSWRVEADLTGQSIPMNEWFDMPDYSWPAPKSFIYGLVRTDHYQEDG